MYNASTDVTTKVIEPKRIIIEWDGYSGCTTVEWKFAPHTNNATFASITESGWTGNRDHLVKYALTRLKDSLGRLPVLTHSWNITSD
jgi:hypothetical protein